MLLLCGVYHVCFLSMLCVRVHLARNILRIFCYLDPYLMSDNLNTELGPIQFDYISVYENSGNISFLCILLYLLWASYLVHLRKFQVLFCIIYIHLISQHILYVVGNTAESYFSAALGSICEVVKYSIYCHF